MKLLKRFFGTARVSYKAKVIWQNGKTSTQTIKRAY